MLTEQQLENNKAEYLDLINSITLEGANIAGFVKWLNNSDFFSAPASSKYHCDFMGGLCLHSLNVYRALVKLVDEFKDVLDIKFSEDSIKIVALLHDISKTNFYELYFKNVKNDSTGVWEKVPEYKTRDADNRFIYGSHEQNSEYIAHTFFPLSLEESTAILHHHNGLSWDSAKDDIPTVYGKYTLALLLHMADMIATYGYEK